MPKHICSSISFRPNETISFFFQNNVFFRVVGFSSTTQIRIVAGPAPIDSRTVTFVEVYVHKLLFATKNRINVWFENCEYGS
jgi:hypothetical protein